MKDNRTYYDDFAGWYERERHHGYHALLDTLQIEVAAPLVTGLDVLEVGCGTGLILERLAGLAHRAVGVDMSRGMLQQARERNLEVVEGSATALPFPDASFDAVVSFKVLAHIAEIELAMAEVARVLRPGGKAALEFYNRHSLRYAIKRFKHASAVSASTDDTDVYTRYDTLDDIKKYLPETLEISDVRGIRVFTPFAQLHDLPIVSSCLAKAERLARDCSVTARFGGFLVAIVTRK